MKHYIAKLVFKIINNSSSCQLDEQIRLIRAANFSEASEKAVEIGEKEEDDFLTDDNRKALWKFIALAGLYPLENLEHGVELYSSVVEKEDADNYLHTLRLKHMELTSNTVRAN